MEQRECSKIREKVRLQSCQDIDSLDLCSDSILVLSSNTVNWLEFLSASFCQDFQKPVI